MVLPPRGGYATMSGGAAKPAPAAPAKAAAPVKAATGKKKKETVTPANISKVNEKLAGVVPAVMDILAKEVGVSDDELADNIAFTDLGVDSLMSLTVSGRIREELDLDLDSHAFVDHPTIGAFKSYLAQFETPGRKESITLSRDSDDSSDEDDSPEIDSDSNVTHSS